MSADVRIDQREATAVRQDELRKWATGVFCAVALGSLLLEVVLVDDPVRTVLHAIAAAISLVLVALVRLRPSISRR